MIPVRELNFGFADAENYRRQENRHLFSSVFVRTDSLDQLCDPKTFFLMGEKGTGKTAYALYLANNSYKRTLGELKYIRETEYQKFLALKKSKQLDLSDYTNIWRVIIYVMLAKWISERYKQSGILGRFGKFGDLIKAVDEYYKQAFSPEIIHAINFVEESKISAELLSKYANLGGEESTQVSFDERRFQTNLLYLQRHFEQAIGTLKLDDSHVLFIDGIDIRPSSIPYDEYLECVKGLATAVWSVNNDFFSGMKHSKGRLRTVLLIRPDIFESLGLQNQNAKVLDNSVLLDWRTTYNEFKRSALYRMADRLLSAQQHEQLALGEAWDHYVPFRTARNEWTASDQGMGNPAEGDSSFVSFLRFSFSRPRDIVTMLKILQKGFVQHGRGDRDVFQKSDFDSPDFRRSYADYLLGEIKDHLSFYYSGTTYEDFLSFFHYLDGKLQFEYDEYRTAFDAFRQYIRGTGRTPDAFFENPDTFLQFLYELNVVCWTRDTEDDRFYHWSYRERTLSNICPKIKPGERYQIFYGLSKALDTGKRFKRR
jgi:hypothetical protein